jgi:sarcosine oxidase subunit beta
VPADPSPAALPARAEVVIVGGGVVGTSVAFHLAEAGVRDVVLVERDALGSGSTSRAAGGVRAQFSDEVNVRLGQRSLEAFARFDRRPGQAIDLHRVGYLFLLTRPDDVAVFEAATELQRRLGVDTRMVDAVEARRLCPLVDVDDVLAASWSPDSGHCAPESVVLGYAGAARRLGVTVRTGCAVTGVDTAGGQIRAVRTTAGVVATGTVVCAAGAWSAQVAAMVGVDLPVVPVRRQVLVTGPLPAPDVGAPVDRLPGVPMTIDFATSFYFHGEGPGFLLGMSDPDEPPGFALHRDDAWLPRLTEAIARRAPRLLDAPVTGGWAGLYEQTPDHNALVGEVGSVSRFLYATGFSGHGFLQGPAVGEVVRDLVLGLEPVVDVRPLSADRFAAGTSRPEAALV